MVGKKTPFAVFGVILCKSTGMETFGLPLKVLLETVVSGSIKPLVNTGRAISKALSSSAVRLNYFELLLLFGIILCVFPSNVLSSLELALMDLSLYLRLLGISCFTVHL